MNNFLFNIQENVFPGGPKYAVYGDSAFKEVRRCIFSKHISRNGVPLTPLQLLEDMAMKVARQSIEWGFGLVSQLFEVCNVKSHWKLCKERPFATEQLRATYLFCNIYTCLNASVVNSRGGFDCATPRLEDFLV